MGDWQMQLNAKICKVIPKICKAPTVNSFKDHLDEYTKKAALAQDWR